MSDEKKRLYSGIGNDVNLLLRAVIVRLGGIKSVLKYRLPSLNFAVPIFVATQVSARWLSFEFRELPKY